MISCWLVAEKSEPCFEFGVSEYWSLRVLEFQSTGASEY